MNLKLVLIPGTYAVCKFDPQEVMPIRPSATSFFSVTKTGEELSVVCEESLVPDRVTAEGGWSCLKVEGVLDFSLTGILCSLTTPLAKAGISIFAVSTYNTDYLLLKTNDLQRAVQTLRDSGCIVETGEVECSSSL